MRILAQFERTVGNLSECCRGRSRSSQLAWLVLHSIVMCCALAICAKISARHVGGRDSMPNAEPPGSGVGGFVVEALAGPRAAIFRLEPSGGRAQGIITIGRRRQLKRPRLDPAWLRHASFSRHALGRADHLRTGSNMLGNLFGSVHHCPVASLYNHSSCNSNALCNKPRGYRPNKRSE
jgi:hypothetical protein